LFESPDRYNVVTRLAALIAVDACYGALSAPSMAQGIQLNKRTKLEDEGIDLDED
jgi:hypothetical protein